MTIRKILKFPHQDLRVKASQVKEFNEELKVLAEDMLETMYDVK